MQITTIGLDLAKSVFQVHGIDESGQVVVRKRLRRSEVRDYFAALPSCLVGMEACATSHFWARELKAVGHEVKLLPPAYVKAYVKRGKNDALDAEAICEAVQRPSMRFVPIKSAEQQAVLVLHRVRAQLVRERTKLSNILRAHMAEFGMVAPKTMARLADLIAVAADEADARLPRIARVALREVIAQLEALKARIATIDAEILAWHRSDDTSKRLAGIPGLGPIVASAIAASVSEPSGFRSGRHSRPGSVLRPKTVPPEANNGSARYPRWATAICAACWCLGPHRWSAVRGGASRRPICGCSSCSSGARRDWLRLRSPTRWPALPGF